MRSFAQGHSPLKGLSWASNSGLTPAIAAGTTDVNYLTHTSVHFSTSFVLDWLQQPSTTDGVASTEVYFLTLLEAGGPSSKDQQVWFLLRPLSLAYRQPPSCLCPTWSLLYACVPPGSLHVSKIPFLIRIPDRLD